MPRVRTTDGHLIEWDRKAIVKQLLRETKLSKQFYKISGITEAQAKNIAREVERRIRWMNVKFLSGPLVREIVNVILLERHHIEWRNICTRVGTPVYDAHLIDVGSGFEAHENANLQENAETSHKKKADKISKEQYLLLLPPYMADRHLAGDLHIHDLEYFGTRPFCQDWDLRYFFYYGLMPDGSGTKASVAGPAKKPEVAMLHAVKALAAAQTNFAGGQGFYNFLTFLAPYLEDLSYVEICQLMQMFVYEMTQMMVARGGQVVFSSVQLSPGVPKLWRDKPVVYRGKIWDGKQAPSRTYGEFEKEVRFGFKALMEVMLVGDNWGKPFNFPKPEISIEPDFMTEDEEFNSAHPDLPTYQDLYLLSFKLAAKYGTPYYDNQLPAYRGAGTGISCYQCLAADELIPLEINGQIQVRRIGDVFTEADDNDIKVDPYGVEFVKLRGRTPSINFDTLEGSLKEFRGVMRRRYRGRLLNIILESGRRIKVTPDHPVFVLENGAFSDKSARDLNIGDYLPVLKDTEFDVQVRKIKKIEVEDYNGYVCDLVDVSDTHNFSNALGVVTGNCCAYQFSATFENDDEFDDKLYFKDGKHFSMGSWQVVSLNCPRAAYLARGDDELLFEYLRELMDTSVEIFKIKREWMDQIVKSHRMPFSVQQPKDPNTGKKGPVAVDLEGLVYTIGVVGVNEMVQFHTGSQIHESKDAWKLAVRAMTEMELYARELSQRHNMTIVLARTPAETTVQRFAVSDILHEEFRDCVKKVVKGDLEAALQDINKTRDLPIYYSNGTHLPPSTDVSIFKKAELEHVFFPIVDGGNIFHIFMGEEHPDPQGLMDFAMKLARNTQIGYFTFTLDMTICLDCFKVNPGLHDECPNCGSENVDWLSRVTGYLQSVSGWNEAKKQELKERHRNNMKPA
ncbi:MAG: anaerobic ribonucleoside-triphosphate reductase [Methanotrichaceae archaeon]